MHVLCPKPKYKNIQSTPNTYHLTLFFYQTFKKVRFVSFSIHINTTSINIRGATLNWELTEVEFVLVNCLEYNVHSADTIKVTVHKYFCAFVTFKFLLKFPQSLFSQQTKDCYFETTHYKPYKLNYNKNILNIEVMLNIINHKINSFYIH